MCDTLGNFYDGTSILFKVYQMFLRPQVGSAIVMDTKNISKNKSDRKYFLSMQASVSFRSHI